MIDAHTTLKELKEMCSQHIRNGCEGCEFTKQCDKPNPEDWVIEPQSYWLNITKIYEQQREKGLKAYGQVLEDNHDVNQVDRIRYVQEELVDALMYLEWLKDSLSRKGN